MDSAFLIAPPVKEHVSVSVIQPPGNMKNQNLPSMDLPRGVFCGGLKKCDSLLWPRDEAVREELHVNGPIVRFGFGGRLLVILPLESQERGEADAMKTREARIYDYGKVLRNQSKDYESQVLAGTVEFYGGPEKNIAVRQRLSKMFERLSSLSTGDENDGEEMDN